MYGEEKSLDGISYVVYKTEYKTMVGEEYELEESIGAVVLQEYYINKDTGKIERIKTDTSDLDRANNIAISMYTSGDTLEEATEKANIKFKTNTYHQKNMCWSLFFIIRMDSFGIVFVEVLGSTYPFLQLFHLSVLTFLQQA